MMIVRLDSTNHVDECYMASRVQYTTAVQADPTLIFVDWPAFVFSSTADFFQNPKAYIYDKNQKLMLRDNRM